MNILLAEDEAELSRALVAVLRHTGYEVDAVYDGEAAVRQAAEGVYDCMVFDIMMPKKDGIRALTEIRAGGCTTPVILLTAKAEVDDRVVGLDAGADDYLTKPFSMKELLARIRSQTRRSTGFTHTELRVGCVTLNTAEQELSRRNAIRLAGKETKLMEYLMLNEGKTLPTLQIYRHVWAEEAEAGGTPEEAVDLVWMYISYLRNKLAAIDADLVIEGARGDAFTLHTA